MPRQRQGQRQSQRRQPRRHLVADLRRRFADHELPIYASAIAFRGIIAIIPLVLLGLGLLGALGLEDTWRNSIAPAIQPKVLPEVFAGINASVDKIFSSSSAGLIAFATALAVWDLSLGMLAVMRALNHVHDVKEDRSTKRRALVAVGLAVGVGGCLLAAVLLLIAAPLANGVLHVVFGVLRWVLAPLLLMLAVGLLVRFAPAQKPEARWASVGSLLVIVSWIVATILFKLWITYVADFKTAIGTLTSLLLLTTYFFVSSAIFLVGAELDELLRKETRGRGVALPELVAAVVRR
jgi:membrane protein